MLKIELIEYKRRIESLIAVEKWDEAVLHCNHILKTYPKYYDIYVLLGRIYLERQDYPEGFDILQRILSVEPDDFFSHIGLSVIYEVNRNSDRSLYHMERAFEIQNSNKIILEEITRLSHLSDATLPARIRMTKGALIKLYYKSGLFDQAIIESAEYLKRQPERHDIAIIKVKSLHAKGSVSETIDLSRKILGKLPYCREILKLLTEIIQDPNEAVEVEMLKKRMIEIDPYSVLYNIKGGLLDGQVPRSIQIEPYSAVRRIESSPPSFSNMIEKGIPASANQIINSVCEEEFQNRETTLELEVNSPEENSGETYDIPENPALIQVVPMEEQVSSPEEIINKLNDQSESPNIIALSDFSPAQFSWETSEDPENSSIRDASVE